MPFSGGTYTGLSNTFNNAAAGTIIDPNDWNDLFTDIEDAFNDVVNAEAAGTPSSYVIHLFNHEHFR